MKLSSLSTRLQHLAVLLPLLWGTERAQADEGIPALLRFAEQYRAAQIPDTPEKRWLIARRRKLSGRRKNRPPCRIARRCVALFQNATRNWPDNRPPCDSGIKS